LATQPLFPRNPVRADPATGPFALTAWYMTTGEAGFRTQARGLASRIAGDVRELTVDVAKPWRYLPAAFIPSPLDRLTEVSDHPAPPWPDVLVSCSRKAAAVAIAVKRASGGRTLAIHVQNPLTDPRAFDLVVAMDHDGLTGPNVISVPTALHDVTPARLGEAAKAWRKRLFKRGRPLVGVVLGGSNKHQPFTLKMAGELMDGLQKLRRETGAGLAITPSRRTPEEIKDAFQAQFAGDPDVFCWDMQGENPYLGILALSDRLVVTSDSVSMISEALATDNPVEVFGPEGGRRHAKFLHGLVDKGLVRPFTGERLPPPPGGPIDSTEIAAQAARALVLARA
jgi:mitochondrial fission protein ELM1